MSHRRARVECVRLPREVFKPHPNSEDEWEDLTDEDHEDNTTSSSPSLADFTAHVNQTPRKRKLVHQFGQPAASPRRPTFTTQMPKQPRPQRKVLPEAEEIIEGAQDATISAIEYSLDVFGGAMRLIKRPLYVVVALLLLVTIFSFISATLRAAFAPLCWLPGVGGLRMCRPVEVKTAQLPKWADYPKLVNVQSATFEHLLDESIAGSGLSLEIKKAEMATTDLVTLVRVSNLKAKDMLASTLGNFVSDAKKTGRDLQKLSSKVGGAVDSIMAVNDFALNRIEEARAKNAPSLSNMYGIAPWRSERATNGIVAETFGEAMNVLSSHMERLILEAEVNVANLNKLEERLVTLHELVHREDSSLKAEKAEILAELWTILGGNKKSLRNFDDHLLMLKNLGMYRKKALAHVVAALQTLQSMGTDMEDIRERVAAPELTGSKVPVEIHMQSIKSGLERLREGRVRAKRLEEDAIRKVLEQ